MTNWPELASKYFLPVFDRLPVTLVKGDGCRVWDDEGKEYLDFVAGWAVNSLGHCHPAVVSAVTSQISTLIHTSNSYYTVPQIRLAELLVKSSCLDRVFFSNSGAEANETAVKLARRYGRLRLGGAFRVITARNSFHGRTLMMVAATGQEKFQHPYEPIPDGFINVDYNSVEAIEHATDDSVCAVMLEPIQGEGGVNLPSPEYLRAVRDLCDRKGILLILDEVQTGIGRTGTLYAYEQHGIEPDVMTLAKGLASGMPIGATLAKEEASVFSPGEHGSTFGGNPVVCQAAFSTLSYIIENNIPAHVNKMGEYFLSRLEELQGRYSIISDVRGKGLLLAMEFKHDLARDVVMGCLERGLLVNKLKSNALRFMPPLIVERDDVDRAVTILEQVISTYSQSGS